MENIGKEEIIRAVCQGEDEIIGTDRPVTHQSCQVKLLYDTETKKFHVRTFCHGCYDGQVFATLVAHDHCLCLCNEEMTKLLRQKQGVNVKAARKQYQDDIVEEMKVNIDHYTQMRKLPGQDNRVTTGNNISTTNSTYQYQQQSSQLQLRILEIF